MDLNTETLVTLLQNKIIIPVNNRSKEACVIEKGVVRAVRIRKRLNTTYRNTVKRFKQEDYGMVETN